MPGLMWRQCRICKASLNWIGKGCSMQGYVLSPWWWHKVATAPTCAVQMLFRVSVLTFKDLRGTGASYLRDHISVIEHNLTQQLHSTRTINVGKRLVTVGDRSFTRPGSELWNSLPDEIRMTTNFSVFTANCKTHLYKKRYCCTS